MKRSEFLKRLGLGAVAAVAAPALLKGEEKAQGYHKAECLDDPGKIKSLAFWRQSNNDSISSEPTFLATACYPSPLTLTEDAEEIQRKIYEHKD